MPLLERDDVLDDLEGLVAQARLGNGHVALVRGEAGIGKTAVARELARSVAADTHVLWGSCDDLLAARPLGPVWDMAPGEPDLARALAEGDQRLVHQVLLDVFTRTHRPTLAVFEDVHWADGATLDLLTLVGRRITPSHTVLVVTFREVAPDHPLRVVLGDLPADRVRSTHLQPLSRAAVDTLVAGRDADDVFARTGGNPFLVAAVLSSPDHAVPSSVGDLMGSLVARLAGKSERLVRLVSIVPGGAELALLDEIDPDLAVALGAAEELGLVALEGQAIRFRHELARTAVEHALAEPLRRELHGLVLAAGERLGHDVARLAHHARNAMDVEAMVRLLPDAARQAAARQSHREALTQLEALEPHFARLPLHEQAELHELWAGQDVMATGHGLRHALDAVELRQRLDDDAGVGAGLVRAARSAWAAGDYDDAFALAGAAVDTLDEVGGEELALAHAELARMAAQDDDPARADVHAAKALELVPEPSQARALALCTAGFVRNLLAYPEGNDLLGEAERMAASLGLAWELQRARGNLIDSALVAKDVRRARRLNDAALDAVDDDLAMTWFHVIVGSLIDVSTGNYAVARPVLRDMVGRDTRAAALQWFAEVTRAELLVRTGDPAAGPSVRQLWDRACGGGRFPGRAWISTVSSQYLWVFRERDDRVTARNLEIFDETVDRAGPWLVADHALWLWLDGHLDAIPDRAAEPVRWLGEGRWKRAAHWFADRGLPFEQAVALGRGDSGARREGLQVAHRIGARALAARLRHELRAEGVVGIPRGPRRATEQDPLGLTPRQGEVLDLVADGLSNAAIAQRLFLSVRTVENHVSAILATLGVANRDAAAMLARDSDQPR